MKLEQLKYILEIEKCASMGKASHNLFLTQQSLSHAVKSLENELNVVIFNRFSSGVSLTEEGELVSQFAKKVLNEYEDLKEQLKDMKSETNKDVHGELTLYINKLFEMIILPEILMKFCKKYPNIRIKTKQTDAQDSDDILENENFVWMVNLPRTAKEILDHSFMDGQYVFRSLFEGKFVVCVNKEHRLNKQNNLALKSVLQYPLLCHGLTQYENSILDVMIRHYGDFHVNVTLETSSYEIWLDAIAEGLGVGFIYDKILDKLSRMYPESFENIAVLRVKEYMGLTTGFAVRQDELGPEEEIFADFLIKNLQE